MKNQYKRYLIVGLIAGILIVSTQFIAGKFLIVIERRWLLGLIVGTLCGIVGPLFMDYIGVLKTDD